MAELSVNLPDNKKLFVPGDILKGNAVWQLDHAPKNIFLRLFWYTRGKGTEDIEVVSETVFDHPQARENRPFEIPLPQSPYSFNGKLVSLIWALELVPDNNKTAVRREIVISPYGDEVDLLKHSSESTPAPL